MKPQKNPYLTVSQAAGRLGLTVRRVRQMLADGKIPAVKLGDRANGQPTAYLIVAKDVDAAARRRAKKNKK